MVSLGKMPPRTLGEKVADEARRIGERRPGTLSPDPSPVDRRETGVLPNALWEDWEVRQ